MKCSLIFLIVAFLQCTQCEITPAVPQDLLGCYQQKFTVTARPPLTMPLLIELIRKIELNPKYTMNTRMFTAWIMRQIVYDGITRTSETVIDDNFGIAYSATLNKFNKFKVINDYLISSNSLVSPREFLELDELCFLHKLASNTVDASVRGEESITCQDNSFSPVQSGFNSGRTQSACPIKLGNIKTKWGSISVSHLIAGIATGLQQNQVTFQRILDSIHTHTGSPNVSRGLLPNENDINYEVDNVLFATIVGDLAEVVLSQASGNPIIGNQGYWNDTVLPKVFYLRSPQWDLTQAEILGGIDAALLGKSIQYLVNILDSTKLSQIIDMYYSDDGIPYHFGFHVNNRAEALEHVLSNANLEEQIYGATTLLQAIRATYPLTLTAEYVKELSALAENVYKNTSEKIVNNYDQIEYVTEVKLKASLEVIVIIDNTFTTYETQRLLYALGELIDLSNYGSRIGIISGQTGNWIANVTNQYFQMFRSFEQLDQHGTWPTRLSLGRSLETVVAYYQNRTRIDCAAVAIKPIGQAVVVFSNDGRLTDSDATQTRNLVESIKSAYPHTSMVYVSQDRNNIFSDIRNREDDFLINPSADALTTASEISSKLSRLPASLFKYYCDPASVRFEQYLTPGVENNFEIHREYTKRGYITTKFLNKDYGDLSICFYTSRTSPSNILCQSVTVNGEISFNSGSLCTPESPCDVQYSLTANNSQVRCAENDCRYPHQVLVIITSSYTSGSSGFQSGFMLSLFLMCLSQLVGLN